MNEITVVCGEDGETAIYLNGELQKRRDTNDAYEIARATRSQPCRVETRNPDGWQCGKNWPKLLKDVPIGDGFADAPAVMPESSCRVAVYLDLGIVFEYEVSDPMKGREHAAAIVKTGYRHTSKGSNDLEWFPPHRIEKVKVGGGGESSAYRDRTRAT